MNKTKEGLPERDIKILKDLYDFRILKIDQIVIRTGYKKDTIYKYIRSLFKSGFVTKSRIKGYTEDSKLRGDYFRITNKGISTLRNNGYEDLHYAAEDLKVSDVRAPIEILFTDLHYDLSKKGWKVLGNRKAKERYGINRVDNLTGVFSSPVFNIEYPFYIFQFYHDMSAKYVGKIISEINKYSFSNIVLFTTTRDMFEKVTNTMLDRADIFTYKTFRILPLQYGLKYLSNYAEGDMLFNYIDDKCSILRLDREADVRYEAEFDDIVDYNGEEYYLANLTDFNLANLYRAKRYTKEKYEKDGRKILALSNVA